MTGEVGDTAAALGAGFARDDAFVKLLGAELVAVGPGFAELAMTVRHDHLNFNGSCHGGAIFALADTAFGFASNSHWPIPPSASRPTPTASSPPASTPISPSRRQPVSATG
jgi:acyl-coenzyme A thioesterase PaaI-like protein